MVFLLVLAVAGCSRDPYDNPVPVGCRAHSTAYVRALDAAPREVRINDVRISDCLAKDASTADLHEVGGTLVEAAGMLADKDLAEPLGYLVGAARRGAKQAPGIWDEIVRRLEQEAVPLASTRFYRRGLRAGLGSG